MPRPGNSPNSPATPATASTRTETAPAANAPDLALGAPAAETWIGGCPRCRGHLLQLAEDSAFIPTITYETDNFVAVLGMVAAGLGVALTPSLAIDAAAVPSGVLIRPHHQAGPPHHPPGRCCRQRPGPAIAATAAEIMDLDTSAWSLAPIR